MWVFWIHPARPLGSQRSARSTNCFCFCQSRNDERAAGELNICMCSRTLPPAGHTHTHRPSVGGWCMCIINPVCSTDPRGQERPSAEKHHEHQCFVWWEHQAGSSTLTHTGCCLSLLDGTSTVEVCTGFKLKPKPGPYPRSSDPTRPDPSGTVKFKARTRNLYFFSTTNSQFLKKKRERCCISRLHAMISKQIGLHVKKQMHQSSDSSQGKR